MLSVLATMWLMVNLSVPTWRNFGLWMAVGLLVYLAFGRRRGELALPRLAIGLDALTGGRHAFIHVTRQFLLDGVPAAHQLSGGFNAFLKLRAVLAVERGGNGLCAARHGLEHEELADARYAAAVAEAAVVATGGSGSTAFASRGPIAHRASPARIDRAESPPDAQPSRSSRRQTTTAAGSPEPAESVQASTRAASPPSGCPPTAAKIRSPDRIRSGECPVPRPQQTFPALGGLDFLNPT